MLEALKDSPGVKRYCLLEGSSAGGHLSASRESKESGWYHGCSQNCSPSAVLVCNQGKPHAQCDGVTKTEVNSLSDQAMLDTRPPISAGHQPWWAPHIEGYSKVSLHLHVGPNQHTENGTCKGAWGSSPKENSLPSKVQYLRKHVRSTCPRNPCASLGRESAHQDVSSAIIAPPFERQWQSPTSARKCNMDQSGGAKGKRKGK